MGRGKTPPQFRVATGSGELAMPIMLRHSARALAVVVIVLPILHILSIPACATVSITVSPTKIDLTLNTRETSNQKISLRNTGDETTAIRVYAMDFSVDRENNYSFSEPGHESYSCASWLGVDQPVFELGAGETRQVDVTISVPQAVEPGGHYGALFFETVPPETEPGVSVAVAGRIPSLFYLTIPGITEADMVANAEIGSLVLPGWVDGGPVEVGAVIRNTGNVHLTIATRASFTDFRDRQAGELDLGQTIILPGTERVITGTWDKPPFIGPARVAVTIGYFDDHDELVNKSVSGSFWIVPWRVIMIAIASLGLVILAILILRKKFRLKLERRQPNGKA
jgi:P pilus assembly chaperone PapD